MKLCELNTFVESNDDIINSKSYKMLVRRENELIKRFKATKSDIKRTMLQKQIAEIGNEKAAMLVESNDDIINSKAYKTLVRRENELIKRFKETKSDIK